MSRAPFRSPLLRIIALVVLALSLPGTAAAQYFGKNKVQWEDFDFKILRTEHFDIYYYGDPDPVINDAARMAERWYDRLSRSLDHSLTERKPIVLYANHADFQQTTTTRGMIGEGTGGFTDSFRNRVVMPLTGDYAETDHVLGHELVHVFQFDMEVALRKRGLRLERLPLWMIEGMAEYFSQGRVDTQTSMWLRDAAIHDKLPNLRELNRDPRFSPYQYGQAFWAYIGGRFGDNTVAQLFLSAGASSIEDSFDRVLGLPAEQVFKDWHEAVKKTYEPVLAARPANVIPGSVTLNEKRTRSDLNISPSVSPDGRWVAFLSTRDLFSIDLFLADAETGKVVRTLVRSSGTPHFDALRFIDSSGDWSPDGKKFAFVVFERGDNRIGIVDIDSGRIERRITVPGVNSISNPVWSPDGKTIALSGSKGGMTDIYVLDVESKQVRQLTNDPFGDLQPSWSPDGRKLVFVSERGGATSLERLVYRRVGLSMVDVESTTVTPLPIFENAKHINPEFSPDGSTIYFISDPAGVSDIFSYRLAGGVLRQLTNVPTGVSGITELSPALTVATRSGKVMYTLFEGGDWNIYTLDESSGKTVKADAMTSGTPTAAILPPFRPEERGDVAGYLRDPEIGLDRDASLYELRPYRGSLSLEYVGPPTLGISTDRLGVGYGGSISAIFSDLLGEKEVGVAIQSGSGGSSGSSLDQFGGQLYYLNREQRVTWGGSASHLPYTSARVAQGRRTVIINGVPVDALVIQQRIDTQTVDELSGVTQYPFSRTRRLELNAGYSRFGYDSELEQIIVVNNQVVDRQNIGIEAPPSLDFYRAGLAYVGDSSTFGFISPVRGTRYRFEAESFTGDLNFLTGLADYRRYKFMRPVTVAVRGLFNGRYGSDAESGRLNSLYIGRSTLVRGYEINSIDAGECSGPADSQICPEIDRLLGSRIAVGNVEVRVPLFGNEDYGLFNLPYLPTELVAFADAGAAWTEAEEPELKFEENTTERVPVFSVGIAARVLLGGYLPLQFYYALPFQRPLEDAVFGFTIAPGW